MEISPIESLWYCWWLKSCTTWDVWNPINNGKNHLSTGAGFQPSTVFLLGPRKQTVTLLVCNNTKEEGQAIAFDLDDDEERDTFAARPKVKKSKPITTTKTPISKNEPYKNSACWETDVFPVISNWWKLHGSGDVHADVSWLALNSPALAVDKCDKLIVIYHDLDSLRWCFFCFEIL